MSVLPVFAVLCIYCMQQVTLQTPQISIKVDVEKVIQDIDEDVFMGVTLDCYMMQDNWEGFDFSFLKGDGGGVIIAATLHHYYFDGRHSVLSMFMDTSIMDSLKSKIESFLAMRNARIPGKPVWLGETSSAYNTGTPGISNSYVAGFFTVDLNGAPINLVNDDLPPLTPRKLSTDVTVPPTSLGFLVFPEAGVSACTSKWP